jgi:hypothetical protein
MGSLLKAKHCAAGSLAQRGLSPAPAAVAVVDLAIGVQTANVLAGKTSKPFSSCRMWSVSSGFDGGLGGEAEERSLLDPGMREILAQPQEPRRRQLDGLTALKERTHDVGSEVG